MLLLTTQSDERLALLARNGHDFAFEELVRRYREPLTRYLRRLLGDASVASDALERGMIRAWAALLGGNTPVEVRVWLYATVHAVAVGHERGPAVSPPGLADGLVPAVGERMRAVARGAATALVPPHAVVAAATSAR